MKIWLDRHDEFCDCRVYSEMRKKTFAIREWFQRTLRRRFNRVLFYINCISSVRARMAANAFKSKILKQFK